MLGTKYEVINRDNCKIFDDYILDFIRKYNNIIGHLKISSKTGHNTKNASNSLLKKIPN
jgi:hypothetical protein